VDDEDAASLTLDGPAMLQALQEARRTELGEVEAELLDALEGSLCPGCGRTLSGAAGRGTRG
jgi:hypothetical protein